MPNPPDWEERNADFHFSDEHWRKLFAAADFVNDLKPKTREFLLEMREEEIISLKSYILLRSTSSILAWTLGGLIGGITAIAVLYQVARNIFTGGH